MNETGFRIEVEKTHWAITSDLNKSLLLTDSDNQDYLTFIETINEAEGDISSMLII